MAELTDTADDAAVTDDFFASAARGDVAAPIEPAIGPGSASLPRLPTTAPQPGRGGGAGDRRRLPRWPPFALGRARWLGAAACVVAVGGLAATVAAVGDGSDHPRQRIAPTVERAPLADRDSGLDVHAPRHIGGDDPLGGGVVDRRSGVREVALYADGTRIARRQASCRPACPVRLAYSFEPPAPASLAPAAVALVATDAAGNSAVVGHDLVVASPRGSGQLTAALDAGRHASVPFRRHATGWLAGRLTRPDGRGVANVAVVVHAADRTASNAAGRVGSVRTDRRGRWRIEVALDASRTYVAVTTSRPPVVSPPVPIAVRRAPVSARLHSLPGGRRVIVGRLAPPSTTRRPVVIGRRTARGWVAVATANASAVDGRFEIPVPADRGPVAAFAAPAPDVPFAPAGLIARPANHQQEDRP